MRAFVAVDVGEEAAAGRAERSAPQHLTLRFLGEIDPARVAAISEALEPAVRDVSPFTLTLDGVGAFPSIDRPRVVWIGVTLGADRIRELAARVAQALGNIGFASEREEFVPHLTLLRVRSPRDRQRARAILEGGLPPPPPRSVRVDAIALKESTFGPDHRVSHRTVRTFPLHASEGTDDR